MKVPVELLIEKNEKLIYKVASKYTKYYNIDDLFQVGVIGLIKAAKNYKKNMNTKFSSYAYLYIIGEIVDFVAHDRNIKVTSEQLKTYKLYEETSEILCQQNNKVPTFSEVCKYMDLPEDYVYNAILSSEFTISLDNTTNDNSSLYDITGYNNVDNIDKTIDVRREINNLNELNKKIIYCRYYKDLTQSETANYLGMSQVQVSRYEKSALESIRENIMS